MNDRINKTSICSIVFLDIIDYSKIADADQIEIKTQFNALISRSLKNVAQNDRIILDTGDGVAIAHMGSPEDAMFVALTIRDGILKSNMHSPMPLYVRFGINLGPVRIVSDINGQPNIIGDGINVAQRIMSFAEANQILVSRSYYEVTSRLTLEFSEMFAYSGLKHDKHVREHEVYSVRHKENVVNGSPPPAPKDDRRLTHRLVKANKLNWKYAPPSLLVLVALFVLAKSASVPTEPVITFTQPPLTVKTIAPSINMAVLAKPSNSSLIPNEKIEDLPLEASKSTVNENSLMQEKISEKKLAQKDLVKAALTKKKAKHKVEKEMPPEFVSFDTHIAEKPKTAIAEKPKTASKPAEPNVQIVDSTAKKEKAKDKSGWSNFKDSVKQGTTQHQCTQAEIAMGQCH